MVGEKYVVPTPLGTNMTYCLGAYREISTLSKTVCGGKAEYIVHPEQYIYQKTDGETAYEPVGGDAYAQRLSTEVQVK